MNFELTTLAQLTALLDEVKAHLMANELSEVQGGAILLALEEVVVNALHHSGIVENQGVSITCSVDEAKASIVIAYGGVPFDPSRSSAMKPVDPGRCGGDGLRLARNAVNNISYQRQSDINYVTLLLNR